MKLIVSLFILAIFLEASSVIWYSNYDKALQIAKNQNKDLMIFIIKKDSKKAKRIFVDIFQDEKISHFINKNYISVVSIFEDKNSYPIELFYTLELPSIFFVSNNDESFISIPLHGDIKKVDIKNSLKISQH